MKQTQEQSMISREFSENKIAGTYLANQEFVNSKSNENYNEALYMERKSIKKQLSLLVMTFFVSSTLLTTLTEAKTSGKKQPKDEIVYKGKGGDGSGGNNDSVFAIQEIQKQNPGLLPHEVLIEAFNKSVGRVPEMSFSTKDCPPTTGRVECTGLLGTEETRKAYSIDMTDKTSKGEYYGKFAHVILARKVDTVGPLLGNEIRGAIKLIHPRVVRGSYPIVGILNRSDTGLIFSLDNSYHTKFASQKNIEFRQYNSKVVVFVEYPVYFEHEGTKYKACFNEDGNEYFYNEAGSFDHLQYCTVGYFWIE